MDIGISQVGINGVGIIWWPWSSWCLGQYSLVSWKQCFWVPTSALTLLIVPLIPKGSLLEQGGRNPRGNQLIQVHQEMADKIEVDQSTPLPCETFNIIQDIRFILHTYFLLRLFLFLWYYLHHHHHDQQMQSHQLVWHIQSIVTTHTHRRMDTCMHTYTHTHI